MNDVPFHLTVMGRNFYERTMPALIRELERLNENLERVAPPIVAQEKPVAERAEQGAGPTG